MPDGTKQNPENVTAGVYTTEAATSAKRSKQEKDVPDPTPAEAAEILKANEVTSE